MKKFRCIFVALAVLMFAVPSFAEGTIRDDLYGSWKWSDSDGVKLVAFLPSCDGMSEYIFRKANSLKPLASGQAGFGDNGGFSMFKQEGNLYEISSVTKISDNEYKLVNSSGGGIIRLTRFVDKALSNDYLKRARSLYNNKKYFEAYELAARASIINPKNVDALLLQADYYARENDFNSCYEICMKIRKIDPRNKKVTRNLKWAEDKIKKSQEQGI